jgi:chaperonin GroES
MAVNIQPLSDRVLVQPITEKEVKQGGIIIPDTAKEKPQEAKVIALGTGKLDDEGKKIEFTVKKGDTRPDLEVRRDGDQGTRARAYLIMREDDILGILG